jgi:hypothetical protein
MHCNECGSIFKNTGYATLTFVEIHLRVFLTVHIISTAEEDHGGWH